MIDLLRLEAYYDALPRSTARVETHGPLTLFVRTDPSWPYYARPRLKAPASVTPADVTAVRHRQRELGIPEAFEWIDEVTPGLSAAAEAAGMIVRAHPILVLDKWDALTELPAPDTFTIRRVSAADPALASVRNVQHVGFGVPGTEVGTLGPPLGTSSLPTRVTCGSCAPGWTPVRPSSTPPSMTTAP